MFGIELPRLCERAAQLLRQDYEVTTVTSSLAATRLLADGDYEIVQILAPGLERSSDGAPLH